MQQQTQLISQQLVDLQAQRLIYCNLHFCNCVDKSLIKSFFSQRIQLVTMIRFNDLN